MSKSDAIIYKYENGKFIWNKTTESFSFLQNEMKSTKMSADPSTSSSRFVDEVSYLKYDFQYKNILSDREKIIFNRIFRRPDYSNDPDIITIADIRDLICYTVPSDAYDAKFIDFIHNKSFDEFLNALAIYFDQFLKLAEVLLVRRDNETKIRDQISLEREYMMSKYLSQNRLLLAKSYAKIVLGSDDLKPYHHMANKLKKSRILKDAKLFKRFMSFCTRFVWIVMHRWAIETIDYEMDRLFRSTHYNSASEQNSNCPRFTKSEQKILYGPNNVMESFRRQLSPVILELIRIKPKDYDLLKIGQFKYQGFDQRLFNLELDYVTPISQLCFTNKQHGILGHPKEFYDTMLTLNWFSVRKRNFTEQYDPFNLIRQPIYQIGNYEDTQTRTEKWKPSFKLISKEYEPHIIARQRKLWKNRDRIIESFKNVQLGQVDLSIKANEFLAENIDDIKINEKEIILNFLKENIRTYKKNLK